MVDIVKIAHTLHLSVEEAIVRFEEVLTVAQVWFAELEDATIEKDFTKMRHAAHQIALEAETLQLYPIIRLTEELELLTTFRRETDYNALLEKLYTTLSLHFQAMKKLQPEESVKFLRL